MGIQTNTDEDKKIDRRKQRIREGKHTQVDTNTPRNFKRGQVCAPFVRRVLATRKSVCVCVSSPLAAETEGIIHGRLNECQHGRGMAL